jgi:hypothetical protein
LAASLSHRKSIGDKKASLFAKIISPIMTTEGIENAFLQFHLYDERNNQTIKFVTYNIAIKKPTHLQIVGLF